MAEGWEITNPGEQVQGFERGGLVEMMEVSFKTAEGAAGHVRVPLDQYTPERVHQLIEERVQAIRAIANL